MKTWGKRFCNKKLVLKVTDGVNVALLQSTELRIGQMKDKEEISVQNRFNTANGLPQKVREMKLLFTIASDLFQCDHPSRGPHTAFCTQHSRRPKVTCHQECSAQSVICCPLRSSTSGPHQDRL
ncbi:hypothetical protein AVEN_173536-1 [Araneus ventricosus]|uniref:Uncharacterized protein n=1 Tax=Araneus ventricosus TaxID=182803 RepID=A0A4Y2TA53_ARAVE|nr:hypothetical protein AVEN_173536-1 [Araneus ventricosus]